MDDEDLDEDTRAEFLAAMREQVARLTSWPPTSWICRGWTPAASGSSGRSSISSRSRTQSPRSSARWRSRTTTRSRSSPETAASLRSEIRSACSRLGVSWSRTRSSTRHRGHRCACASTRRRTSSAFGGGPGAGHPPEGAGEQVFERFYRAEGGRSSGSGLGLAIARELAVLMGGTIQVESRPGRTVFSLALPVPEDAGEEGRAEPGGVSTWNIVDKVDNRSDGTLDTRVPATFSKCPAQLSTLSSRSPERSRAPRSCSESARQPAGSTPGTKTVVITTQAPPQEQTAVQPQPPPLPSSFNPETIYKKRSPGVVTISARSRPARRARGPASSSPRRVTCSRTRT